MADAAVTQDADFSYFPDTVAQIHYINLDRSVPRKELMEKMTKDLGIRGMQRYCATDRDKLSDKEFQDAMKRVKLRDVYQKGKWHFSGIHEDAKDKVLPMHVKIPERLQKYTTGRYANCKSYIGVMKKALSQVKPGDEDKWILILEDDAKFTMEDREAIHKALSNAPQDAGAIMLGAETNIDRAFLPIRPEGSPPDADLGIPSGSQSAIAIAYRPGMLRAMLRTQEVNFHMSRNKGGISPCDLVNLAVHNYLTGMPVYRDEPEYRIITKAFIRASRGLAQNQFYLLNPSHVRESGQTTTIGTPRPYDMLRYQEKWRLVSKETAQKINAAYYSTSDLPRRNKIVFALTRFCLKNPQPPPSEETLVDTIEKLARGEKTHIGEALGRPDNLTVIRTGSRHSLP